jgi:hypothetical protein
MEIGLPSLQIIKDNRRHHGIRGICPHFPETLCCPGPVAILLMS